MRYPASEKREIIRPVERFHLPVHRALDKPGIPTATFYRWYDRYRALGEDGLNDRNSAPGRVWNRIPDDIRRRSRSPPAIWSAEDDAHRRTNAVSA